MIINGYVIKADIQRLEIYAPFDNNLLRNCFDIIIESVDSAYNNQDNKVYFDFYGSHIDCSNHKIIMNQEDIRNAFECILSDALIPIDSFCDFMSDFGYTDCKEAKRIYDACKEERDKLLKIGIDEDEMYRLLEIIREDE